MFQFDWPDTVLFHILLVLGVAAWAWSVLHILTTRYTPAGTSAWLLLIFLLPYVGVPLYALFGGRKLRRVLKSKAHIHLRRNTFIPDSEGSEIDRLLRGLGIPGATGGNRLRQLNDGRESWEAVTQLIDSAERSIDLLVYVFKNDEAGRAIVDHLARKAASGVKVRVLYDSMGSWATNPRFFDRLVAAGGEVVRFMPTGWWPFRSRTNLRNHRKILVVDQRQAWAGGMNIGEEYMGPGLNQGRWLDISFTLQGPAVQALAEIFRSDWAFATGEVLEEAGEPSPPLVPANEGIVQIVPSGPDVDHDPLYSLLVALAYLARRRLWIVTPYFVPNESLSEALCLAALRGLDVRIFMPQRSNHLLPDLARGPYLRDLQKAGAKVHLSRPMLHAKLVIVDDAAAIHGSANIDARSLFLNFEVATICYSPAEVQAAEQWVVNMMGETVLRPLPTTLVTRLTEGTMRLVSPLL